MEVSTVHPTLGQAFILRLFLQNQGFGSLYNPKGLRLVMVREGDGMEVVRELASGFHGPPPGGEARYEFSVTAPQGPGTYALWLEIYDPHLPQDPRYNLQLASRLEYREGRNNLGLRLEVR